MAHSHASKFSALKTRLFICHDHIRVLEITCNHTYDSKATVPVPTGVHLFKAQILHVFDGIMIMSLTFWQGRHLTSWNMLFCTRFSLRAPASVSSLLRFLCSFVGNLLLWLVLLRVHLRVLNFRNAYLGQSTAKRFPGRRGRKHCLWSREPARGLSDIDLQVTSRIHVMPSRT